MKTRIVTYDDFTIDYDNEKDICIITDFDEGNIYEAELIKVVNADSYSENDLLTKVAPNDEDYSGEFDNPDIDDNGNEIFYYGYWKIKKLIDTNYKEES